MEILVVSSSKESFENLVEKQNIWSATEVDCKKVKELKYLWIYKINDPKFDPSEIQTLELYEIIDFFVIWNRKHKNFWKTIFLISKQENPVIKKFKMNTKSEYMTLKEFELL